MSTEKSEEEHIENQINQLREAIIALENQSDGVPGIEPESLWHVMEQNMDENESVHPKIQNIMVGHVNTEEVKKALLRLENDLHDLRHIGEKDERLYDPFKNDIEGEEDSDNWEVEEDSGGENQEESATTIREKEQRPLTAYINSSSD
jgi:hypothetical protein